MSRQASTGIPAAFHSFLLRMLGAARLDGSTYEEVDRDPAATGQTAAVVL